MLPGTPKPLSQIQQTESPFEYATGLGGLAPMQPQQIQQINMPSPSPSQSQTQAKKDPFADLAGLF